MACCCIEGYILNGLIREVITIQETELTNDGKCVWTFDYDGTTYFIWWEQDQIIGMYQKELAT